MASKLSRVMCLDRRRWVSLLISSSHSSSCWGDTGGGGGALRSRSGHEAGMTRSSVWTSYHYRREVLALEATDGVVQRLVHGCRDPLGDQTVQVDGATQQLQDGAVTVEDKHTVLQHYSGYHK